MKLVIAEKPSVAMALASVLGARTRKDGYVEGNGYIVFLVRRTSSWINAMHRNTMKKYKKMEI